MRSFLTRRPSPAFLLALVSLFVALDGSTAYATAANFLLNTGNTSTAQTTLNGSLVAGKAALKLSNTNTGSGSTALALNVASGHPPFTVSTGAGKVKGLNADSLDGIDSTGLVQGKGSSYANAVAMQPGDPNVDLPVAPNLTLTLTCVAGQASVRLHTVNSQSDNAFVLDTEGDYSAQAWVTGAVDMATKNAGFGEFGVISIQQVLNAEQTITQMTVGMVYRTTSADCHFQVQTTTLHQ